MNTILKLAKDLPPYEHTFICLLHYLQLAVQNVDFPKTAHLTSLAHKKTTFGKLNLFILTAAQLEGSFKANKSRLYIYFSKIN